MDDFLARKLLIKKKKETIEQEILEQKESEEQKEIKTQNETIIKKNNTNEVKTAIESKNQIIVENLAKDLQDWKLKYNKLHKQYSETKDILERYEQLTSDFKKWINFLDLILNEGRDTVNMLKEQIEELGGFGLENGE